MNMATDLIKCIVVDDDLASLKITELLIKKTPFLELQACFTDPVEAADYLTREETHLVFLDIEMPNITGLELIGSLKHHPSVIIISSKKEYAFDAFALNVIDYLVKPIIDYPRFLKAALKAKQSAQVLDVYSSETNKQLFVKVDSILHSINTNAILWIEALGDYVKINTDGKVMTTLATMKSVEARLPENLFARVHRSFIINLRKVNQIDFKNLSIGDKIIPISSFYREGLVKKIELL
jgi:DNA-binding LytR/AlgR family response regulator